MDEARQKIEELRKEIDIIDDKLISILVDRFDIVKKISVLKKVSLNDFRQEKIMKRLEGRGLPPEFIEKIYRVIFCYSKKTYYSKKD